MLGQRQESQVRKCKSSCKPSGGLGRAPQVSLSPFHVPQLSTLQDLHCDLRRLYRKAQRARGAKGSDAAACTVQWSPWDAMKDCYKSFCCVENAKFGEPATVQPGDSWRATQDLAVIDL